MKPGRRSVVVAVVLGVLTACGASPPPAAELALEAIDTLDFDLDPDTDAGRIESIRECMRNEVTGFTLTDEQAQGFEDLDDVAAKADQGNELAQNILAELEASLAACR